LRPKAAGPTHAPVIFDDPTPAVRALGLALLLSLAASPGAGQRPPERVLVRSLDGGPLGPLPVDRGTPGLRHRLVKLRTTGSVLYTTGHPDDEEAGALTLLSRGMGARTALLTLNRGEGGANALGPELFDALGLLRTEELRLAGRYYGLDGFEDPNNPGQMLTSEEMLFIPLNPEKVREAIDNALNAFEGISATITHNGTSEEFDYRIDFGDPAVGKPRRRRPVRR